MALSNLINWAVEPEETPDKKSGCDCGGKKHPGSCAASCGCTKDGEKKGSCGGGKTGSCGGGKAGSCEGGKKGPCSPGSCSPGSCAGFKKDGAKKSSCSGSPCSGDKKN